MRILAAAAALFLAACQTPCPAVNTEPTVSNFTCEDGSALRVTFTPTQATVEQEGYVTLTLPSRTSGGAYRYSANGAELRGRAANAQWTRPGAAETLCSIDQ
ncbi:MAG TPA: MliC family protein [Candidatus Binatia bacterium]|nr:MliC family protein [Candidatus Binatia bacterium]